MDSVLVIGGAGYVGSHCARAIRRAGFLPVVLDDLSTGHRSFCRWGPLVVGDVRRRSDLDRAFETARPVAVVNLAAQSIVPHSVRAPATTYEINVLGALNVLGAMVDHNVRNIVFSSSCAVYGVPATPLIGETTPLAPVSPYGTSKMIVERMLDEFGDAHGIGSAKLRYFNAAGAAADDGIGEWHDPETHLVPIALDVALGLRSHLSILGTDYDTPDGTAIRDFVHVEDLAQAHVAALRHLLDGGRTIALNIGRGAGASVAEIAQLVERATGLPVPVRREGRRPGDPPRLVADPSAAERLLGWGAEHNLSEIVEDAWTWHRTLHAGAASRTPASARAEALAPNVG